MKFLLEKYNVLFLWVVFLAVIGMHFFPQANKFDLMEDLSPNLVLAGTVFVFLCLGYLKSFLKKGNLKFGGGTDFLLLSGFVLFTALSFLLSSVKSFGFGEVFILLLTSSIYFYFATCFETKNGSRISLVEKWLPVFSILFLVVHLVVGLYGYFTTDHGRFFGLFYNPSIKADAWPNAYATIFLLTFPFAVYWLVAFMKKLQFAKWKWIFLCIILGGFFATFALSLSRAGMIAFAIQSCIAIIIFAKNFGVKNVFKKSIIGVVIFTAIFSLFCTTFISDLKNEKSLNAISERYTFNDKSGATSFSERFEFFSGSVEIIKNNFLFGTGPASFKWVYPQYQKGFLSNSDHPHNILLKFGSERGVASLAFFIFFVGFLFYKTNPFAKNASTYEMISWTGIAGAFAHSMVDFNFNFVSNELFLYLIFASLVAKIVRENLAKLTKILSIFMVFLVLILLPAFSVKLFYDTVEYREITNILEGEKLEFTEVATDRIAVFNPLFPRWWLLRLDDSVVNLNNIPLYPRGEVLELREIFLTKEIIYNSHNIEPLLRLAKLAISVGDLKLAKTYLEKAIEINPKNTFEHYALYAGVLKKLGKTHEINTLEATLAPLISEYKILYEKNIHFTRRDGEIEFLNKITE